jgi:adenylate cyclase
MDRRRLAAILVADVVGYSRLMEADESGTHAALKRRRSEIFDPLIQEHAGRLVKFMGDGMLVEFPSAVSAVSCALAIQKRMAEEDRQLPEAKQIALRIGINVGDVIDDGAGDIFGEGVNIAARLEGLADSGRIAISGIVHDSLGNRIGESFADAGEHQLKNISRPVHVWRWAPDAGDAVVAARSRQAGFGGAVDPCSALRQPDGRAAAGPFRRRLHRRHHHRTQPLQGLERSRPAHLVPLSRQEPGA